MYDAGMSRHRRTRVARVVLAALLLGGGAEALECPRPRPPTVEVTLDAEPPVIDRSKSVLELSRLKQPGPKHEARGLYTVTVTSRLEIGFDSLTDRRQACVAIDYVKAHVELHRRTIHVAREHPAASCEAKAILEHERKHQAMDENVMARELPGLKSALAEATRGAHAGPIPATEIEAAQSRLKRKLGEAFRLATLAADDRRAQAQAQVDTPGEYARVRGLCPGGWQ